jgi:repressor LexA
MDIRAGTMGAGDNSPFDRELVRQAMRTEGVTQHQLAEKLGLPQSAVSNILNGSRRVKVEEADTIYKVLGLHRQPNVQLIPIIGLTNAGNWREAIQHPDGALPMASGIASDRAFAVEVKGDSLDRIVQDGEFVVCDPDQRQLYDGNVYLIENTEFETQIKVYRSNPARFEPSSTNETHQPVMMGSEPIKVIGRIVWRGGPL